MYKLANLPKLKFLWKLCQYDRYKHQTTPYQFSMAQILIQNQKSSDHRGHRFQTKDQQCYSYDSYSSAPRSVMYKQLHMTSLLHIRLVSMRERMMLISGCSKSVVKTNEESRRQKTEYMTFFHSIIKLCKIIDH